MNNLPIQSLDGLDRAILSELQREGRLSNVELADKVGLSESACLRRVRRLEHSGVIDRYVMLMDPAAIGRPGSVFVSVSLEGQQKERLARFEEEIQEVPEVMECYLMTGAVDYILRVIVRDAEDFERVHNALTCLGGVARVHSSFTLRTVLKRTALPLGPASDSRG